MITCKVTLGLVGHASCEVCLLRALQKWRSSHNFQSLDQVVMASSQASSFLQHKINVYQSTILDQVVMVSSYFQREISVYWSTILDQVVMVSSYLQRDISVYWSTILDQVVVVSSYLQRDISVYWSTTLSNLLVVGFIDVEIKALEIQVLTLYNINLHFAKFLLPPHPTNNVGLSETCVEAGITNTVNKGRNNEVEYSKNPIYIVQDCLDVTCFFDLVIQTFFRTVCLTFLFLEF